MSNVTYLYCDESCHLEHDRQKAMVLGALSCPAATRKLVGRRVKALKRAHGISAKREIKWTQISPSRVGFYLALVDLFFDDPNLGFRAVVVPDKNALDHQRFQQSHDDFYYKMWWQLLTRLVDDQHQFHVFIDIKETNSSAKLKKLHEVLCNTHYDFDHSRVLGVEAVHAHHVPLLQLADVLIGAVSHANRGIDGSTAKAQIITRIRDRSGLSLMKSTPPSARKFNILIWRPKEAQ